MSSGRLSFSRLQRQLLNLSSQSKLRGVPRRCASTSPEHIVQLPPNEFTVEYPKGNIAVNLFRNSHKWMNNIALSCSTTGADTTYGQLKDQIARWAGFLKAKGLKPGDVVAVIAPNLNEYTSIVYGGASVGVVYTGVNPTYTPAEMANQITDSDAKMIVIFQPLEKVVRAALTLAGKPDIPLVTIGPANADLPRASDIFADKSIPFVDPMDITGDELFALMYSSGTTGKPKGAKLSHNCSFSNIVMATSHDFLSYDGSGTAEDQGSLIQLLPMFHAGGLMGVNGCGLHGGMRLVNYLKFDPANFMKVLNDYKITDVGVVPAILNFMAMHPSCNPSSMTHVKSVMCGTAPLSTALVDALLKKAGHEVNFQQAYGMTELLFATFDRFQKPKMGYVGQVLPMVQLKVLDLTDGRSLPAGEDGELCFKSPSVMMGYHSCEGQTAATIDEEGWLHTGDVGHYDGEGYVKIVDRTKDLVKVKGLQVSPSEIEDVLLSVIGVREAAVVGVPHERQGEAPKAFVVVADPSLTEAKLQEIVAAALAPHKHLVGGVEFLQALPRNATGKVLKKELK